MRRAPGEADLAFVETLQEIKARMHVLISAPIFISAWRSMLPFSVLAVNCAISSDV